jgi:hypothetical protein
MAEGHHRDTPPTRSGEKVKRVMRARHSHEVVVKFQNHVEHVALKRCRGAESSTRSSEPPSPPLQRFHYSVSLFSLCILHPEVHLAVMVDVATSFSRDRPVDFKSADIARGPAPAFLEHPRTMSRAFDIHAAYQLALSDPKVCAAAPVWYFVPRVRPIVCVRYRLL